MKLLLWKGSGCSRDISNDASNITTNTDWVAPQGELICCPYDKSSDDPPNGSVHSATETSSQPLRHPVFLSECQKEQPQLSIHPKLELACTTHHGLQQGYQSELHG